MRRYLRLVPLLEVDPVRIREVLINLVTNAFRHTPDGGQVRIGAATERRDRAGIALIVADTGSGIRPEDLPHVFERFYKAKPDRADGSTVAAGGRGLGLTIAKDLTEAHGGTIEVESERGQGTTLRVWLPIDED